MKAITYDRFGGPEVLRYGDAPTPSCHPRGVVIRVAAVSIEGGDLLDRSGNFAPSSDEPRVIGRQAAGTVAEVGVEAAGFAVGDRVVAVRPNGSHAEFFAAPARTTWRVPDGLDLLTAATIPIPFATAYEALTHYGGLAPGETVVIQAGAGAVGMAAVQIARSLGAARILATASSDSRMARLAALGATGTISSTREDLVAEVRRLAADAGADLVVDAVGGSALQASLEVLGRGGRLVALGQASRAAPRLDLAHLYNVGATVRGLKLDIASDRVRGVVTALLQACADGAYQVGVGQTFPLSEAAAAHAHAESRAAVGRTVLTP